MQLLISERCNGQNQPFTGPVKNQQQQERHDLLPELPVCGALSSNRDG